MILLLLASCWLERVTGEPSPLDPRFYASVEAAQGQPGEGGGDAIPFGGAMGDKVMVRGRVVGDVIVAVDIDVRTPDPQAEGGVKGHGKLLLEAPGTFELAVPSGLGPLELQAFQDLDADGPGGMDPFAQVELDIGDADVDDVDLVLVAGARGSGTGPVHREMPPGTPGGGQYAGELPGTPVPAPPVPVAEDPFAGVAGERVHLRGTITVEGEGTSVDVDLFRVDPSAPGGRAMAAKFKLAAGAYDVTIPVSYGDVIVESFVDLDGNGPGRGDPMGVYAGNPLSVGKDDLDGVDLFLEVRPDGRMPGTAVAPPPSGI